MKKTYEKQDEIRLIEGIRAKNPKDEAMFYELYRPMILRQIQRLGVVNFEEAEDLTQETLIKALLSLRKGGFTPMYKISAWLTKIGKNEFINHLRSLKKMKTLSLSETDTCNPEILKLSDHNTDAFTIVCKREEKEIIWSEINMLSPTLRDAVISICFLGYKYSEYATLRGIPIGTVKTQIFQARAKLTERPAIVNLVA